ncbi:MAG TPA: ATP synthase F0 subunit C [Phycisphaerae bacterium]|nr:ATP synthase F0 subunit C [Phycisphaerae bacterium]HUT61848.1 ATP synthase F0 subunit C [Phycisphaerae bacterium]
MTKRSLIVAFLILAAPALVLAEGGPTTSPSQGPAAGPGGEGKGLAHSLVVVGACLGAAAAAIGGGYAISRVAAACMDAMARQPEASGHMFAPMIITAAMIEGSMLFAIVVCMLGMYA